MMKAMSAQFALPLTLPDEPSLSNFIRAANTEAVAQCELVAQGRFEHMTLYFWGVSGAGKTHLLHSLAKVPNVQSISASDLNDEVILLTDTKVCLVDNVDMLNSLQQEHLFHLYNQLRTQNKAIVIAAACAPAQLPIDFLPDLKTRLGWDLIYQLHPLTDEDKAQVLVSQAEQRGLTLGAGVVNYMLRHLTRDLSQLHRFLTHLDEYSLQKQRALTLPLLKEWLAHDDSK